MSQRHMTQCQTMQEHIWALQTRLKAITNYIKPVIRAVFTHEPLPIDPAAELDAVLDRCWRLWPRLKYFVKQAGTFVAYNILARVQSHYPTVDA